jgi:hypothetical protein
LLEAGFQLDNVDLDAKVDDAEAPVSRSVFEEAPAESKGEDEGEDKGKGEDDEGEDEDEEADAEAAHPGAHIPSVCGRPQRSRIAPARMRDENFDYARD